MRENELLGEVKVLKGEVNSLRGRMSLIATSSSATSSSSKQPQQPPATPNSKSLVGIPSTPSSFSLMETADQPISPAERQQRLIYLRQAFVGFFKAKHAVEMQHLGRVICAILGVTIEEQTMILENISKLTPAVVASTTFDSFSQSFASIFS